jgi:hypothetical protein
LKAYCLIRTQPHYRHEAFVAGLKRCGYDVHLSYARWPVRPGDVLVIWNRYGETERIADGFEAAGGTVLVAENGYIGRGGGTPKHTNGPGNHYYALARHAHNGRGRWSSSAGLSAGRARHRAQAVARRTAITSWCARIAASGCRAASCRRTGASTWPGVYVR